MCLLIGGSYETSMDTNVRPVSTRNCHPVFLDSVSCHLGVNVLHVMIGLTFEASSEEKPRNGDSRDQADDTAKGAPLPASGWVSLRRCNNG
jgi:hypothetical protein